MTFINALGHLALPTTYAAPLPQKTKNWAEKRVLGRGMLTYEHDEL